MSRRKHRVIRKYTPLGKRLASLGCQRELARVLNVTQQTVSKKLRGECAVTVSDLERLAKKHGKPLAWFFMLDGAQIDLRLVLGVLEESDKVFTDDKGEKQAIRFVKSML